MKKIYSLVILTLLTNLCFAYSYLSFSDPRTNSKYGNATIDEVSVVLKPAGVYFQYDLYMSFSARGYDLTVNDTLELVYFFDMPMNTAFTDSWLWIGDSAVQAGIYDIGTATNTYENIVKRRRDPSVLYKRNKNQYELRIFPMAGNEIRKIKLSCLVPANWSSGAVSVPFPANMFSVSRNPLEQLNLKVENNPEFGLPVNLSSAAMSEAGNYTFNNSEIYALNEIAFASPVKNGIYFHAFEKGGEKYFQAALLPEYFIKAGLSRKVVFGIDYDTAVTNFPLSVIVSSLKEKINKSLSTSDSFRLVFNGTSGVKWGASGWISASSSNIDEAFAGLQQQIGVKSNVIELLKSVYGMVQVEKGKINFALISGGPELNLPIEAGTAEALVKKYKTIPTNFAWVGNKKVRYIYDSYSYYYSPYLYNSELYTISYRTGGVFLNSGYGYYYSNPEPETTANYNEIQNFKNNLGTIFRFFEENSGSANVYPVLENGFAYSINSLNDQKAGINKPVIMTGKYSGSLPATFLLTAEYNDSAYFHKVTVSDASETDSLIKKFWVAMFIDRNEDFSYNFNPRKDEITQKSIDNRVLSMYTAFLALEPGREVEPCSNCQSTGGIAVPILVRPLEIITNVEDRRMESVAKPGEISASPNPFSGNTRITLSGIDSNTPASVNIYNTIGEIVLVSTVSTDENGNAVFVWDGKTATGQNAENGIYTIVINAGPVKKSSRVVLLR
jgi:hypothetical protein